MEQLSHLVWGKTATLVWFFWWDSNSHSRHVKSQSPSSVYMSLSLSGTMYLHPLGVWTDGMTAQLLNRRYHDTRQILPFPCDLLVLSLPSAEWFYSFLMSCIQERGKVFNVLRHRFAWTEISASTEMVMTIHEGNTLWAGDGRTTIKRECRGFRGRRTRGMEWEIQVGNLRSPFQESDRFWSLYLPLIKACQWGWSLWHRSLHTLVVLLNYSSCSCDNIVIRRSLIEFTVWLWPIGR